MKTNLNDRYAAFGGIQRMFNSYKMGSINLSQVSDKVGYTSTSVSNDIKSVFGLYALEEARSEIRCNLLKKKKLDNLNAGKSTEMKYEEAQAYKNDGHLSNTGYLTFFDTIINIAKETVGEPKKLWFSSNSISKIEGETGIVRVRYAKPNINSSEYNLNLHRFKITPTHVKRFKAFIFCLIHDSENTFYALPSNKLQTIQSLNLKFSDHKKPYKYSEYLAKVEKP